MRLLVPVPPGDRVDVAVAERLRSAEGIATDPDRTTQTVAGITEDVEALDLTTVV